MDPAAGAAQASIRYQSTAAAGAFDNAAAAKKFCAELGGKCVVKADGLALGKGVLMCANQTEAEKAVDEIMVGRAFGAAGIVTSGAARDLDQVRRLGFPAFSNGAICSHGYSHIVDLHGAVRVGGVTIHPGDLIHADANGVTTIPLEIASEVAQAAGEFVAAESGVLDYLKSGNPDAAAFREARQGMLSAIAALGKRVRGKSGE